MNELPPDPASSSWDDVRTWRRRVRELFIERRMALASHVRRRLGEEARGRFKSRFNLDQYETIGIYWPIRGEIDPRDLVREHLARGGRVGLPVVVTRGAPVEFWRWQPGIAMARGLWNIPVPRDREVVQPQALIIPLVGFDEAGYRLGYGGGYYDRTIAAARPRPFCIGIGYADFALRTIFPQPHDMRMDAIVTERNVLVSPAAAQATP